MSDENRSAFTWANGFDPDDRPWRDTTPADFDEPLADDPLKDAFWAAQFAMQSAALALDKLDRLLCIREGHDPEWAA